MLWLSTIVFVGIHLSCKALCEFALAFEFANFCNLHNQAFFVVVVSNNELRGHGEFLRGQAKSFLSDFEGYTFDSK